MFANGPIGVLGTLFQVQMAIGFIVSGNENLNQPSRTKYIMIFLHISQVVCPPKSKI